MGTTNYHDTFISVAEDCRATIGTVPPEGARPSVARLTWEILTEVPPYSLTSDDVLFAVHAERQQIPEAEQPAAREAFLARPQACLRASPLTKTYGWGLHFDAEGRIGLYGVESDEYRDLVRPEATTVDGQPLTQRRAMRSRRR